MNQLEIIYYKVDKWLRPYRYHFEDELFSEVESKGHRKKTKIKGKRSKKHKQAGPGSTNLRPQQRTD